jgi:hypothetical protein
MQNLGGHKFKGDGCDTMTDETVHEPPSTENRKTILRYRHVSVVAGTT